MPTDTQKIPAYLWDSLQEMCFRQDYKFLLDVSRIIGVPAADIKRRILGIRGVPTVIPVEHGPWWMNTECPIMDLVGGSMWRRCASLCEQGDSCWNHRGGGRRYDDPYFTTLPKRRPMRYEGAVYWVDQDGGVMNGYGALITEFTMDLNAKTVNRTNGLDMDSSTKTRAIQETECRFETSEGTSGGTSETS